MSIKDKFGKKSTTIFLADTFMNKLFVILFDHSSICNNKEELFSNFCYFRKNSCSVFY